MGFLVKCQYNVLHVKPPPRAVDKQNDPPLREKYQHVADGGF